jgi:predicted transcriptional regulator of viral defense system
MRDNPQPRPADVVIAAIAARQHGVIGHTQLTALGVSRQAIQRRVQCGRLHRVHRGVYAVGHKRLTQRGRWMAAVLAGGDGAVLSHRTAAALWQILPARGPVHIATPRKRQNRDSIRFHSQSLQFDELTEHDGIPVTTVARTLIDIAATESKQFERAFNEAEFRRLYDQTDVLTILSRDPARRGAATIRALAARPHRGITREELEHRFQALVEKEALPRPELNADLELEPGRWIQADCLWRDARLIVELDSRAAHDTTSRFDSDRERDRLLALGGWTVVRVTWKHVTSRPDRLAADLRKLMAARG